MIIYKKDNSVRLQVHQSADSEVIQEISGEEYAPDYHTFSTVEELSDFYSKAVAYINNTLSAGWLKKEQIKWELYQ